MRNRQRAMRSPWIVVLELFNSYPVQLHSLCNRRPDGVSNARSPVLFSRSNVFRSSWMQYFLRNDAEQGDDARRYAVLSVDKESHLSCISRLSTAYPLASIPVTL